LSRVRVIIPAHDEELLIGGLIDSIHAPEIMRERITVLVLADNCNDRTYRGRAREGRRSPRTTRYRAERQATPFTARRATRLDRHDATSCHADTRDPEFCAA
jgi:hypothetical protein